MIYYRIRNWQENFENNRTRDMEKMRWVPVPNKHDGEGFQRIMQEKDGIIIYGCWHLILQVASKCGVRGTLLRDDGTPITADTLSIKTGWRKAADFQRTLDFCCGGEMAWIERLTDEGAEKPQATAEKPQATARNGMEWKEGIEGKEGKEGKSTEFNLFYQSYPRKVAKQDAERAWHKAKDRPPLAEILAAIERQKQGADWRKDNGEFIPHPATWLNQGRWADEVRPHKEPGAPVTPPESDPGILDYAKQFIALRDYKQGENSGDIYRKARDNYGPQGAARVKAAVAEMDRQARNESWK